MSSTARRSGRTRAQYADWLFILARTDPDAPKHRGISLLLLDVKTPGDHHHRRSRTWAATSPSTRLFFDDVRVPVANRVGEENRGWYVGMATLDFERSGIGATVKYRRALEDLVAWVRCGGPKGMLRDSVRHEIAQRFIEVEVLNALALRTVSMQEAGQVPNVEASVNQLFSAELHQRIASTGMKAIGTWGNDWEHDGAPMDGFLAHKYLEAVPYTVLSGTAEIQRNVIATRGLGLPRE